MDKKEIEITVLRVMTALLRCPINRESRREEYHQWDSLKHLEVIFAIEDELGVQFPKDVLANLDSVERIVKSAETLYHAA